jgi:hypothetical protein
MHMFVDEIQHGVPGESVTYSGRLFCGQDESIGPIAWIATVPVSSNAVACRSAIVAEGVVQAGNYGFTILPADVVVSGTPV